MPTVIFGKNGIKNILRKPISIVVFSLKSYKENPLFQIECGDWINFKIPNTDLSVPMIQSGWGDGLYPVYFGYDENNEVCEIVIEYFDLEQTFGQEEE